jgi:glycosyltransferase involved in cell wall biosynthesis
LASSPFTDQNPPTIAKEKIVLNILAWGTVPWSNSSYSILVRRTLPNILKQGHPITLGVWYGLQGAPLPWQVNDKDGSNIGSVQILPAIDGANYGVESIIPIYEFTKSNLLLCICDVWVFKPKYVYSTNFVPWLPIDMNPVPGPVAECIGPSLYPLVYSKWGVDLLEEAGIKAHYMPASAPADLFKPGNKAESRKKLGFENDVFVASIVAANKDPNDRKGLVEGILGFARFAINHPDARLYLHTNWGGGLDMKELLRNIQDKTGLDVGSRLLIPDHLAMMLGYLNDDYMAMVYQASDVLLNAAKSEGFGLPLIEAQMCGCPILATDFSTTDELLFAGWKIAGQPDYANGLNSWRLRASIDSVVDGLEEAYRNRNNEKLQQKARNGAMRFDNQTVFNQYWKPALREIESLINRATMAMPALPGLNGKNEPKMEKVLV